MKLERHCTPLRVRNGSNFAVDAGLPSTVPVWGYTGTPVPVVASGEAEGAVEATRHLLGFRHRNVWHLAGPQRWIGAEDRIRGWRNTLEAAGIVPPLASFLDEAPQGVHDREKEKGFYVDVTGDSITSTPFDITKADATRWIDHAQIAVAMVSDAVQQARLNSPHGNPQES